MYDLISIGDAVVDTFLPLIEAEVKVIDGESKLLLPYGDKVPVGESLSLVGGNAANNAVGAAKLKLKTAIYVNIGADHDGMKIKDTLKDEGVDLKFVVKHDNLTTSRHIVLDFKGDRTILVHHHPWKYHLPDLDQTRWVYLTSLSPSFVDSNLIAELTHFLERTGAKLLYNPGTFQIKMGIKKNPRLLNRTEVFIVNLEEAKLILGHKEGDKVEVKELLKGIVDLGPKMVVITDGSKGSFGFDGEKYYELAIFPAKVLEKTGSGDAYAVGVLASLAHGKDLPEAMRWGAANGAAVTEEIGAQNGLLTLDGMHKRLKMNLNIQANEV